MFTKIAKPLQIISALVVFITGLTLTINNCEACKCSCHYSHNSYPSPAGDANDLEDCRNKCGSAGPIGSFEAKCE